METNLVCFVLRGTGSSLLLTVEQVPGSARGFAMGGVQLQRFRYEVDALRLLEQGGIGHWSSFPPEGVEATVTRSQLWSMGFRGMY